MRCLQVQAHHHEGVRGVVVVKTLSLLISELVPDVGFELQFSYLRNRTPRTHRMEACMGSRPRLDAVVERKPAPAQNTASTFIIRQPFYFF